jgi:SCP-2 sterol transfer family
MAVCPAGEDVIGPYLNDKSDHLQTVVRPLQEKAEMVYVVPGSDAESHVAKRFPHKQPKRVSNGIRPRSIEVFLRGLPLAFQRQKSEELNATYHFTVTGDEERKATVIIRNKTVEVSDGHTSSADLYVTADSRTWLGFLAKERSLVWALLTRRIRLKGSPKLLVAFGKCFPS